MLMPAELTLHHGQANAVIIDIQNYKILVGLLDGIGLLLKIRDG